MPVAVDVAGARVDAAYATNVVELVCLVSLEVSNEVLLCCPVRRSCDSCPAAETRKL